MMNPNHNRKKVTTAPMDIIQELLISPTELMTWLTAGAVELYAMGAGPDSQGVRLFTDAISLVAYIWGLEDGEEDRALDTLIAQRDATINHQEGEDFPLMVDKERLFKEHSGKEIISVIYTLIDTMVWLPQEEERQAIAKLLYYLKEFWAIDECLNL